MGRRRLNLSPLGEIRKGVKIIAFHFQKHVIKLNFFQIIDPF